MPNEHPRSGAPGGALHKAAMRGDLAQCEALLAAGEDVNALWSHTDCPAIFEAIHNDHIKVVQLLCQHGADLSMPNPHGLPPVFFAVEKESLKSVLYLLQKTPQAAAARTPNGQSLMHVAIKQIEDTRIIEALLLVKVDVNARDAYGVTPLEQAAGVGNLRLCKTLLRHGADPNQQDAQGNSALTSALFHDRQEIALLLLEAGANPDLRDAKGNTARQMIRERADQVLVDALERQRPPPAPRR